MMRPRILVNWTTVPYIAILGVLFLIGCRSGSTASPQVPTTTAAVVPKPPLEPEPSTKKQGSAAVPPLPEKDTLVVIDSGGSKGEKPPTTLLEASKAEKKRREQNTKTGAHPIVITDANLKTFATGELTTAKPNHGSKKAQKAKKGTHEKAAAKAASSSGPLDADAPGAEHYWRNRVLEIRRRWHDAVEQQHDLKGRIAKLRQEFYAADDPYYRDTQIKPAWDKALADLAAARKNAKDAQKRLAKALEQGRKAGVPPGWLREGIDLQPKPAPEPNHEPRPAPKPGEPQVVEPNAGPPVSSR